LGNDVLINEADVSFLYFII